MSQENVPVDIIKLAFGMTEAVAGFAQRAREFYYDVMLSGHNCPKCGGRLVMVSEGQCRCQSCNAEFDPTISFQRCSSCGGKPMLQVQRYQCGTCGNDIVSRFLFDGMVFDAEYFRQKMAEHRQRKQELRERVRRMLAGTRSGVLQPSFVDLAASPDLVEALNALIGEAVTSSVLQVVTDFDLERYEAHIQARVQPFPISLEEIPPLGENTRRDRIWRFIAVVFLAHARLIEIWQEGQTVMVMKREADTERPRVPGEPEEADGVEGPVGRAEA